MTEVRSGTAPAQLPLLDTIRRSYGDYFNHFGDVLVITWPWMLASPVAMGLAVWLQFSWMARAVVDLKQSVPVGPTPVPVPPMPQVPLETLIFAILANVILVFAVPSIAVAWHRRVLLNEAPGFSPRTVLSVHFWHYAGGCLMLGLVVGLPLMIVAGPMAYFPLAQKATTGPGAPPYEVIIWPMVVMAAAGIVALAALMRLVLLLPGRAIGNTSLTVGDCWRITRGNGWRMFAGLAATAGPPVLLGQAIAFAITGHPGADLFKMSTAEILGLGTQLAVASAVSIGFYLLVLPLGFGFLSHAYRFFFPAS